jgi:hypothetical protein
MNLATEYILRGKRARCMLSLPLSIFLRTKDKNKLIITLSQECDGPSVIVKHWKLWLTSQKDRLPPFDEFKIEKKDVFTSEHVIVPGCSILDYLESPYDAFSDTFGDLQETEYNNSVNNFYNSLEHKERKKCWLWEEFEKIYVQDRLKFGYSDKNYQGMKIQQDLVKFYAKTTWNCWNQWRKHFLSVSNGPAAGELVFRSEFDSVDPYERSIQPRKRQSYYTYGQVSSGSIASGMINMITSGAYGSGQIGHFQLSSGAILSGTVGHFQLSSGAILSGTVGSGQLAYAGAISSGNIASGMVTWQPGDYIMMGSGALSAYGI